MRIFKLEEYLAKHEFTAPYLLCCSDAESFAMNDIIAMADPDDLNLWNNLRLNYTEIKGLPLLRQQIAESFYPSLTQHEILCFAGAEDGIFCALQALCEPSDHVIVLTPCYQSLMEIPTSKGADITAVSLHEENDWRINIMDIKKAIRPNTKCVVMNFPHNPTGQVITQDELEELIQLLDKHGIWLFSDEVYRLLGSPTTPWANPAAEMYSKALSLGVMSKAFGMAGLRIGWIACQDKSVLEKIERVKDYTSICNSAPSEIISLITLKNKDAILSRNNKIVTDNLTHLDGFMGKYSKQFSWVRPHGGCVGFVNYLSDEPVNDFAERLIKERGVLLMPASLYDHKGNHFRIGFGRKNMSEALNEFEKFLEG